MASIKIKFRASSVKAKEGKLYYLIVHNRLSRQVTSSYKVFRHEWDAVKMDVIITADTEFTRRKHLMSIRESVSEDTKRLRNIIFHYERKFLPYTADDVVSAFLSGMDESCFVSFAKHIVKHLIKIGRTRTAATYTTALNSFMRFRKDKDLLMDEVTSDLMLAYEQYLASINNCPNTRSFYMRNLRAIYNRAVEQDLTLQRFPFRHVYTGIDKTIKRAVTIDVIRKIRDLDLSFNSAMDFARDVFMFSFYTRGMSFVDIAYLKKANLLNGVLTYRRKKTKRQLCIKWEAPMQAIVNKYNTEDTPYMLPIIKNNGKDERLQYSNVAHCVNRNLKSIGRMIGLSLPLTTYVARHGWASIASSKNVPIAIISDAMGHDSERTTRIYLASLDSSLVDNANSLILKSI